MDSIFASVLLGFFALLLAIVAVATAIVYRQNAVAQEALRNFSRFNQIPPASESVDTNNDVP